MSSATGFDDPMRKDAALVSYDEVGQTIDRILADYDADAYETPARETSPKEEEASTGPVCRTAPKMTLRSRGVLDLHRVKNTSDRSLGAFKLKSEQGASQRFLDASEGSTTKFAAKEGPPKILTSKVQMPGRGPQKFSRPTRLPKKGVKAQTKKRQRRVQPKSLKQSAAAQTGTHPMTIRCHLQRRLMVDQSVNFVSYPATRSNSQR